MFSSFSCSVMTGGDFPKQIIRARFGPLKSKMSLEEFQSELSTFLTSTDHLNKLAQFHKWVEGFTSLHNLYLSLDPISERRSLEKREKKYIDCEILITSLHPSKNEHDSEEILDVLDKIGSRLVNNLLLHILSPKVIDRWMKFFVISIVDFESALLNSNEKLRKEQIQIQEKSLKLLTLILEVIKRESNKRRANIAWRHSEDPIWILLKYRHSVAEICAQFIKNLSHGHYESQSNESIELALKCLDVVCDSFPLSDKMRIFRRVLFKLHSVSSKTYNQLIDPEDKVDHDLANFRPIKDTCELFRRLCFNDERLIEAILQFCEQVLTSSTSPEATSAALSSLLSLQSSSVPQYPSQFDDRVRKLVARALKSEHSLVRFRACQYLRGRNLSILCDQFAVPLRRIATKDTEISVRIQALLCLGNIPSARKLTAIKAAVDCVLSQIIERLGMKNDSHTVFLLGWICEIAALYPDDSYASLSSLFRPPGASYLLSRLTDQQLWEFIFPIARQVLIASRRERNSNSTLKLSLRAKKPANDEEGQSSLIEASEMVSKIILEILQSDVELSSQVWLGGLDLLALIANDELDECGWALFSCLALNIIGKARPENRLGSLLEKNFSKSVLDALYRCIKSVCFQVLDPKKKSTLDSVFEICESVILKKTLNYTDESRAGAAKLLEISILQSQWAHPDESARIITKHLNYVMKLLLDEFKFNCNQIDLDAKSYGSGRPIRPRLLSCVVNETETEAERLESQLVQIVLASLYTNPKLTIKMMHQFDQEIQREDKFFLNLLSARLLTKPLSCDTFCPQHEVRISILGLCELIRLSHVDKPQCFKTMAHQIVPCLFHLISSLHSMYEQHLRDCGHTEKRGYPEEDYLAWSPTSIQRCLSKIEELFSLQEIIDRFFDALEFAKKNYSHWCELMLDPLDYRELKNLTQLETFAGNKPKSNGIKNMIRNQSFRVKNKIVSRLKTF